MVEGTLIPEVSSGININSSLAPCSKVRKHDSSFLVGLIYWELASAPKKVI
jgi:hypothetical protein